MSGRYLLDTNAAIRIINQTLDLEARPGEGGEGIETFLCSTVVGELLFGAARSGRPEANRLRVERLLELCPVLPHDLETANRYGELKARLQSLGRPIPENDCWIAACALQHSLILVTRDRHFEHVTGLQLETW